ncbi:hypothetical protein BZA05DRAFT_448923 [Tricharina praecox]|uniref:uncharacterized protein n=1 Tax=Tricharina praecox TaxID=43433 RepID=UPI00221F7BED|nr:uncharacterized protein BZA05DRAFT_448923 [Tricharina praecox]KAI5842799.1 hypothetical protein BZA05DRAFT_448923 [Tricharina praecox]
MRFTQLLEAGARTEMKSDRYEETNGRKVEQFKWGTAINIKETIQVPYGRVTTADAISDALSSSPECVSGAILGILEYDPAFPTYRIVHHGGTAGLLLLPKTPISHLQTSTLEAEGVVVDCFGSVERSSHFCNKFDIYPKGTNKGVVEHVWAAGDSCSPGEYEYGDSGKYSPADTLPKMTARKWKVVV